MTEDDRLLPLREKDEFYDDYIIRCCAPYEIDPAPVIELYQDMVEAGAREHDACYDAMWARCVYDTIEEIKADKPRRKITCTVSLIALYNDRGTRIDSVRTTCNECGHVTESYGTSERSVKRCLAVMSEECPRLEANRYEADEDALNTY